VNYYVYILLKFSLKISLYIIQFCKYTIYILQNTHKSLRYRRSRYNVWNYNFSIQVW